MEEVTYEIQITPSNEVNNYVEKITKGSKVLVCAKEKKLFDEKTEKYVDNFFIPENIPLLAVINESRFLTVKLIREFFLRMLFIDAQKAKEIAVEPNAFILNSSGTNLANVLLNWQNKWPAIFQELVNDFQQCFSFIKHVKFISSPVFPGMKANLLAIEEENVNKDIPQTGWSDGVSRALCILCLPKTRFEFDEKLYPPSIIVIDEIENGLDFKTLRFINQYLEAYSDDIQVMMSSHSPNMLEFVNPRNWQVVKRNGSKIKISKPQDNEEDLDEQLDLFRQKYWDFYTKHISNSSLYEP